MIIGCAYFLYVDLLKELSWNILLHCALYTALACNRKADPQNKYNKNIVAFFFFLFFCLFLFFSSPIPNGFTSSPTPLLGAAGSFIGGPYGGLFRSGVPNA